MKERALVLVPHQGTLSVQQRPVQILYSNDGVQAMMMHDYYWHCKLRKRDGYGVSRISPSRFGVNSFLSVYKTSSLFGYQLETDFAVVWEYLYDEAGYNWRLTDRENILDRWPGVNI